MSVRARQATVLIVRKINIRTIREMPSQKPVFRATKNIYIYTWFGGALAKEATTNQLFYLLYYHFHPSILSRRYV